MSGERLLIVGASGRAAAASALRAGFEPFVIDLFADADTKRLCPVLKCEMSDYPSGLARLAEGAPPGPWMYTGGLENHPDVVAAISERRGLWGNGPEVLREVRDPIRLSGHLSWKLYSQPRLYRTGEAYPSDIRWLRKPLRGAGGMGVRFATPDDLHSSHQSDCGFYIQEFVTGQSSLVVFRELAAEPFVFGGSVQLIGLTWLHARPFAYCGSISGEKAWYKNDCLPLAVEISKHAGIGTTWGFDFVRSDGQPVVVEVNPRYTASIEVLEYASGTAVMAMPSKPGPPTVVGKAIYYAPHRLTFPASGPWDESFRRCTDVWRRPDYADISDAGSVVEAGHPVLTLLADGGTEAAVLDTLKERAAELDRLFGFPAAREVK